MASFTTDFSTYADTAAVNVDFTSGWDSSPGDWELTTGGSYEGGKAIRIGATGNTPRTLWPDTTAGAFRTRCRAKVSMLVKAGVGPGVVVRANNSGTGEGYSASLRDSGSGTVLLRKHSASLTTLDEAAFPWSAGTFYWVELEAVGSTLTVKAWADGDPVPTTNLISVTDSSYASGWAGMVSTTGTGQREYDALEVEYYADAVQASGGRIRSSVSEDVGSLLDSTSLNAVDASYSETFLLDNTLTPTTATVFVEAMAPVTAAARYYPLPRQTTEFLHDYAGETLLSRMTRVYPEPVMARVEDYVTTTFTVDGDTFATPQTILTKLFSEWAVTYSWFSYATVPDLRLKVPDPGSFDGGDGKGNAEPSQYTADAELGRVGAQVVFYPQDKDTKLTMRQILDELLSPFPGTVVRANASGQLEIIPSYGPDADTTASVTLTTKDAYTVTTGQPSPDGIINRVTVTSQPYTWTEDAGAYTSSYFDLAPWDFPEGDLPAVGVDANLSGTIIGGYWNWSIKDWQPQSNRFVDTEGTIKLTDTGGTKYVSIDYYTPCGSGEGSFAPGDITLTDLPLDGEWHRIISASQGAIGTIDVEIDGRYNKDSGTVSLRAVEGTSLKRVDVGACDGFQNTEYCVRVSIADASNVWQRDSATYTGTFGSTSGDNPDVLEGGALASSVTAYGVRETSFDVTGYGITDGVLLKRMAEAYVRDAINPTLVRTVEQSVWRAFPVKFSDMGKIVELPSGEQGRLINRAYVDDFGTNFGDGTIASTIKIEVIDQDGDGHIDVDTNYLRLDTNEAFVLDDGTVAEGG